MRNALRCGGAPWVAWIGCESSCGVAFWDESDWQTTTVALVGVTVWLLAL